MCILLYKKKARQKIMNKRVLKLIIKNYITGKIN